MERDGAHGCRGLKPPPQQPAWTPGHNFSLAGSCFSWPSPPPASSYTCGYCRREFRSAQALGGHMNVHRRDRARLRQCCSAMYPPNSPNQLIAAAQHRRVAAATAGASPRVPNLNFLSPHHHCTGATTAEPVVYSFLSTTTTTGMKAGTVVEVDMGMGMGGVCGRSGGAAEQDGGGGLDLELRLGCPLDQ